jgi:S-adenosylmethionine:tRNA ribosyltransferase-isomerase
MPENGKHQIPNMFNLNDYDYHLPEDRIAQTPADQRDHSRLLLLDRQNGSIAHHRFYDVSRFLLPSDVLVVNNTEVIPGRLLGRKETGGKVELLILNYAARTQGGIKPDSLVCDCLLKASKPTRPGSRIVFEEQMIADVLDVKENIYKISFEYAGDFERLLYRIGKTPLPPYIRRESDAKDPENYQTVYASQKGAIAAPTAGFHFTANSLNALKQKGIEIVEITLHIGYGTFLPVRVSDIREHKMHTEAFSLSRAAADLITLAKQAHRRIVAVGTTCVRTLEYCADSTGRIAAQKNGNCDLFIYPGYRFKVVDAMITNFHLPKSTLLMLVSAFAGRDNILNSYQAAIDHGYRFYSYGDAMFIR